MRLSIPKLLLLVPLLGVAAEAMSVNSDTNRGELYDLVSSLVKRVESLESTVTSQAALIQELQSNMESTADTLRRNLQAFECLPRPVEGEDADDLRCAFDNIVRFENVVFFNNVSFGVVVMWAGMFLFPHVCLSVVPGKGHYCRCNTYPNHVIF